MTKFSDLEKKEKVFRIVNLVFMSLIFCSCLGLAIYYGVTDDVNNRLLTTIMTMILAILPFLLEMIVRRRFYNLVIFLYLFYLLLAGVIGSVLYVYYLVSWYDIFVHCVAGYVFALVGLLLLSLLDDYKKFNVWTIVIFCFAFTLATELVWELIEWAGDNLFGQTSQGIPPESFDVPLVTDTMQDILCNFVGGVVFVLHYLIGKLSKYSLGINFIERELTYKRIVALEGDKVTKEMSDSSNQKDEKTKKKSKD